MKKVFSKKEWIVLSFLTFISLLGLIKTIETHKLANELYENGVVTLGKVVDIETSKDYYRYYISYNVNDVKYLVYNRDVLSKKKRIGDYIHITYNKNNPNKSLVKKEVESKRGYQEIKISIILSLVSLWYFILRGLKRYIVKVYS